MKLSVYYTRHFGERVQQRIRGSNKAPEKILASLRHYKLYRNSNKELIITANDDVYAILIAIHEKKLYAKTIIYTVSLSSYEFVEDCNVEWVSNE